MVRATRSQTLSITKHKTIHSKAPNKKLPAQSKVAELNSLICDNQMRVHKIENSKNAGTKTLSVKTDKEKSLKPRKLNEIKHCGSHSNLKAKSEVGTIKKKTSKGYITCPNEEKKQLPSSPMNNKTADHKSLVDRTRHVSENQSSTASLTLKPPNQLPIIRISSDDDMIGNDNSKIYTLDEDEDSFLQHVTSRSPVKPIARIEDSFEALDQLEKVFEVFQEIYKLETMLGQDSPPKSSRKTPVNSRSNKSRKPNTKVAFDSTSIKQRKPTRATTSPEPCLGVKASRSMENISHISPILQNNKMSTKVNTYQKSTDFNRQSPLNNSFFIPARRSFTEKPVETSIVSSDISKSQKGTMKEISLKKDVPIPAPVGVRLPAKSQLGSINDIRPKTDISISASNELKSEIGSSMSKPRGDVFSRLSTVTKKYNRYDSHQCDELKSKDIKIRQAQNKSISIPQEPLDLSRSTSLNFKDGHRGGHHMLKVQVSQPNLKEIRTSLAGVNVKVQNHPDNFVKEESGVYLSKPKSVIRNVKKPHSPNVSELKCNKNFLNTVSLVRLEAAERGRQTIKEWADKKIANKTVAAVG